MAAEIQDNEAELMFWDEAGCLGDAQAYLEDEGVDTSAALHVARDHRDLVRAIQILILSKRITRDHVTTALRLSRSLA